jgi:signal transduction histidine kinase/ActR/RegA family two-component response regulator
MPDKWEDADTTVTRMTHDTGESRAVPPSDKALLVVLVGGDVGRTYVVTDRLVVGRGTSADVRIASEDVSRSHVVIRQTEPGQFEIEDQGSKNGTMVNGLPVTTQVLKYGDKIRVGSKTILMFSQYDEVEDQLMQAQRLESIGQLAGGVAHDFNNILGAVLANVGFLKGLLPSVTFGDREVQECIDDIDVATQRAIQISKQLLGLARRDQREDMNVDMGELVHEVLALAGRTFERSIRIEDTVETGLHVKGDPAQLNQMLMNLCINARDAMLPRGGTLSVSVDKVTDDKLGQRMVQLRVSDTGTGMPEEVRKRIFEPFFTTKGKGEGTGLGLSTVLSIVRQHGGEVEAHSTEGEGTTFIVRLPLLEIQPEPKTRIAGARQTMTIKPGMVLVVDDEEVFLKSTRRLLEGLGYPVQTARDGIEAVQVFDLHKDMIEIVLLDLVMPNMDGEETFHALRRIDPTVRVLISSGQTELGRARELLTEGVQGFLQKPYDAATLGDAISRAMFGPRKWR